MDIDVDPYSACLSRINLALTEAKRLKGQMNEKEYLTLQAIQMECDAADPDFDWEIL